MLLSTPDPALDSAFAAELLHLQHEVYGQQAELIGSCELRPLADDDDTLPAWRGHYLVGWEGTHLVGAVAWREEDGQIEVDRLMVDPEAQRRGVATALLTALVAVLGPRPIHTFTASANAPGLALYEHFGFEPQGEDETPSGIRVTHLRRLG